jgi:hypothetical protein
MLFTREYSKLLLLIAFLFSNFTFAEPPLAGILRILKAPTINYSEVSENIFLGIRHYPENVELLREMARLLKKETYWKSADEMASDIAGGKPNDVIKRLCKNNQK